jgi:hypothetical protein
MLLDLRSLEEVVVSGFDEAMMAAMNWPWPVMYQQQVQVVASGMTPPDSMPN